MVDGVPIIKHKEEYKAQARELQENVDATPRGSMYFNDEKLYFDANEDDLLEDSEDVFMVYT